MLHDISPILHSEGRPNASGDGAAATTPGNPTPVYDQADPFSSLQNPFSPDANPRLGEQQQAEITSANLDALQVGNIVHQIAVLRNETKRLQEQKELLQQQAHFALQEDLRLQEVLKAAVRDLDDASADAAELTRELHEMHRCAPDADDYAASEQLSHRVKAAELRVADKDQHVAAVLAEVAKINADVAAQRATATKEDDNDAAGDGHQQQQLNEEQTYLAQLAQCVEEQRLEVEKYDTARDEHRKLDAEATENETKIRQLREHLENLGVEVPEAPMVHRLRRLEQNKKRLNASILEQRLAGDGERSAKKKKSNNAVEEAEMFLLQLQQQNHDAASVSALSPNRSAAATYIEKRAFGLPVGVMPLLTQQLHAQFHDGIALHQQERQQKQKSAAATSGLPSSSSTSSMRYVATVRCGLTSFSIHCTEIETFLVCHGTRGALDKFESILRDAMQRVFCLSKGVVTYADAGLAEAAKQAAQRLHDLMTDRSSA